MFSPDRWPRIITSIAALTMPGPLVTASATPHTKGSWVPFVYTGAATTLPFDAYLCSVIVADVRVSATDTSLLVDIGADPAGGTSYTVEIPNILAGGALNFADSAAIQYVFPVSIPKGSQVAARIQALIVSDNAIVGVTLVGGKNRSNPFPHRGAIQDYGTNTATSGGTAMADATAGSKGAWTQLGADTTRRHSGLAVAVANADSVALGGRFHLDIGIDPAGGTSYTVVIPDMPVVSGTAESATLYSPLHSLLSIDIPAGAAIAARAQAQTTNAQSDLEVAVYGF